MKIQFKKITGYKYELAEDFVIQIPLFQRAFDHDFFTLTDEGTLTIKKYYKWDGVSGGMYDSDNSMIGGLVHDALYQAIRLILLPYAEKKNIDKIMKVLFRACGMSNFRSGYAYHAVNVFGHSSCMPGDTWKTEIETVEC